MNQKRFLDILGAGGICLLGLALLDGAIKGLKKISNIDNLWETCGIIGGVLLAAYIVLSVFERSSYFRRGLTWLGLRVAKRPKSETESIAVAEARADEPELAGDEPPRWRPSAAFEDDTPTGSFPLAAEAKPEVIESNGSVEEAEVRKTDAGADTRADIEELEAEAAEVQDLETAETDPDDFKVAGFDAEESAEETEHEEEFEEAAGPVSRLPK